MPGLTLTMTEQRLLEKCREIELLCKDLYDFFAEQYADCEEISRLWRKTSDEEQNHAEQFSMALRLLKGIPCQVTVDPKLVDSTLSQMNTVIAKVRQNPPSVQDALRSAIKLENYLAAFHLECVAVFEDACYRKMFNAMMASDNEHIASLQTACDRLAGALE